MSVCFSVEQDIVVEQTVFRCGVFVSKLETFLRNLVRELESDGILFLFSRWLLREWNGMAALSSAPKRS